MSIDREHDRAIVQQSDSPNSYIVHKIAYSTFLHVLYEYLLEYVVPLPVGLLDYWTITMLDILYQDFYIFPMCNKTTWTIGLLDYWTIALSILLHIQQIENMKQCNSPMVRQAKQLCSTQEICKKSLNLNFYMFSMNMWCLSLLDYWTIGLLLCLIFYYQDFYIFPMCNKTTWTIGLLDYCSI